MTTPTKLHEWTVEGYCAVCGEERCKLTELANCEEEEKNEEEIPS